MKQKKVTSPDMPENELRDLIAWRIADERKKKYPEHGGGKQCAADIGIVSQQWSQYENGSRKPKLDKLERIAEFFGIPVRRFTTPPEDWESKRREWKKRVKPGRQPWQQLENTAGAQAAAPAEAAGQPDMPEREGPRETQNAYSSGILDAIEKLVRLGKMRAGGEIPAPVYEQTMEAINRFADLAHAHRTPQNADG